MQYWPLQTYFHMLPTRRAIRAPCWQHISSARVCAYRQSASENIHSPETDCFCTILCLFYPKVLKQHIFGLF